jgi:hypothetical protein
MLAHREFIGAAVSSPDVEPVKESGIQLSDLIVTALP